MEILFMQERSFEILKFLEEEKYHRDEFFWWQNVKETLG